MIFSKEPVNTGRQREIDALKAFSIIMMIITHCIDDLYVGYESNVPSVIINDYLAQSVGAHGFMICMGLGIVYARRIGAHDYIRRGVSLLLTGQLLNLLRYGLVFVLSYVISGDPAMRVMSVLVFSSDILEFAGLFFLLMGVFTKLKLKPWQIFLITILMNLTGMALKGRIDTGNYAVNQFIGYFFSTYTESYFPLFHWAVYPGFGILYGDVLKHVRDKVKFYGILLVPCAVIWAAYYYIGINMDQPYFTVFNDWRSFTSVGIFDVLAQFACNLGMFVIFFFLTYRLSEKIMQPVNFVSRNINRYYCVHSFLIYAISGLVFGLIDFMPGAALTYTIALLVLIVTTAVIIIYNSKLSKPLHTFFGRHAYLWWAAVILLNIIICIWAVAGSAGEYPNLYNDYLSE